MKLASLALVAGGAVFGAQVGSGETHEEVRTKKLTLVNSKRGNTAELTATVTGGVLIRFGGDREEGPGEFELAPDAGGWSMELRDSDQASIKARVCGDHSSFDLRSGDGKASIWMSTSELRDQPGQGAASITFSPGQFETARPFEFEDASSPCGIGVRGDYGMLIVRKRVEQGSGTEEDPRMWLWKNVLQLAEGGPSGPWDDEEK